MFLVGLVLICLIWEDYKWFGTAVDGKVFGWKLPARTDDASMPHVWDVLKRYTDPERRGSSTPIWRVVLEGAWFTFRVAMVGMIIGTLVGLALAIVMQRVVTAERGLLPYVILSQTVPLVALAPLVVGWGGQLSLFGLDWQPWMSVALIAAYLAFFPVAVGALRGLQAPARAVGMRAPRAPTGGVGGRGPRASPSWAASGAGVTMASAVRVPCGRARPRALALELGICQPERQSPLLGGALA